MATKIILEQLTSVIWSSIGVRLRLTAIARGLTTITRVAETCAKPRSVVVNGCNGSRCRRLVNGRSGSNDVTLFRSYKSRCVKVVNARSASKDVTRGSSNNFTQCRSVIVCSGSNDLTLHAYKARAVLIIIIGNIWIIIGYIFRSEYLVPRPVL